MTHCQLPPFCVLNNSRFIVGFVYITALSHNNDKYKVHKLTLG